MLESQISKATYEGNGKTTVFPFAFKVWKPSEIRVELTNPAGFSRPPAGPVDVTLTDSGGTVTYQHDDAPLPKGWKISILRNMPFQQEVDLISGTRFDPEVIETALDQATAERQQLLEALSRAIVVAPGSDKTPEDVAEELLEARDDAVASAAAAKTSEGKAAQSAVDAMGQADRAQQIVDDFAVTVDAQVERVTQEGDKQVARVTQEGDKQVARVTQEGDTQEQRVTATGSAQTYLVNEAGNTQVARIQTEGGEQVERARQEANRANSEADRAKKEADRAAAAADVDIATETIPGLVLSGPQINAAPTTGELSFGPTLWQGQDKDKPFAVQGDATLPGSVTNCVLSAPVGGAATVSGSTITLHAGTRLKISDGLYPDGRAKSIIADVPQDYAVQMSGQPAGDYVLIASLDRGMAIVVPREDFTRGDVRPPADTTRTQLWHDSRSNVYQFSPAGSDQWQEEGNQISPELASLRWTGADIQDFRPTTVFRIPSEQDVRAQNEGLRTLLEGKPCKELVVGRSGRNDSFSRVQLTEYAAGVSDWTADNHGEFQLGDFALVHCTVKDEGEKPVILHGKITSKDPSRRRIVMQGMYLEEAPLDGATLVGKAGKQTVKDIAIDGNIQDLASARGLLDHVPHYATPGTNFDDFTKQGYYIFDAPAFQNAINPPPLNSLKTWWMAVRVLENGSILQQTFKEEFRGYYRWWNGREWSQWYQKPFSFPVGTQLMIAGATPPAYTPALFCNGAAVSRTAYKRLFDVIGTHYGAGDGTSTFNLPDWRGRYLRGWIAYTPAYESAGLPNVTGTVGTPMRGEYGPPSGPFFVGTPAANALAGGPHPSYPIKFSLQAGNPIYGRSTTVTPETIQSNVYIVYDN